MCILGVVFFIVFMMLAFLATTFMVLDEFAKQTIKFKLVWIGITLSLYAIGFFIIWILTM